METLQGLKDFLFYTTLFFLPLKLLVLQVKSFMS